VAAVALLAGLVLSHVAVSADSPLAFQGTADDARAVLIGVASTMGGHRAAPGARGRRAAAVVEHTAVQATEHLAVIFARLAAVPSGDRVATAGPVTAVVPQRTFAEDLALGCGLVRRYGAGEPTVAQALLRVRVVCARLGAPAHRAAIEREGDLVVAAAERADMLQADLAVVRAEALALHAVLSGRGSPAL
jgi:uncharacterized membrane protein